MGFRPVVNHSASAPAAPGRARVAWQTARAVLELMRIGRPHGTLLLLWPSLWSLALASGGRPDWKLVAIFTLGAFLMRSAGCVINDVADRRIDPLVERTRSRPLADGRLGVGTALVVFALLVGTSLLLILHLNRLTLWLSACGLGLAVLYPFTKRWVSLPQAFLGMAFGWGTFMAWAAVTGSVGLTPALLFAATIFWAIGYDTIYAIQDIDDDRKAGVKSSAILFGERAWLWIGTCFIATCLLLAAAGWREGLPGSTFAALGVILAGMLYQCARVRRGLSRPEAFRLFAAHVWVGAAVLAALLLGTLTGAVPGSPATGGN